MPRIPYVDPLTLPDGLKEWHDRLPPSSHLFLMLAHASATGSALMGLALKQVTELAMAVARGTSVDDATFAAVRAVLSEQFANVLRIDAEAYA